MNIVKSPLVSIQCAVYNHEPYLRQCLDGFVTQKTNFSFEAIVHDDASTDGSAAIISEYAEKYPDIIKPIYETENQYSKHDGSLMRIMNAAIHPDAKYIAICEGDDYWTDPYKLQKQFDFMEQNSEYVLCVHETKYYYQNKGQEVYKMKNILKQYKSGYSFDLHYYCKCNEWLTRPLTTFCRKNSLEKIDGSKYLNYKDRTMFFLLLKSGKGFLMPDVMSVYRIHSAGVCSGTSFPVYFYNSVLGDISIYENERSKEALNLICYNLDKNFYYLVILNEWNIIKKILLEVWEIRNLWIYMYMFRSLFRIPVYFGRVFIKKYCKKNNSSFL